MDQFKPSSMRKHIGFLSRQFVHELIQNKIICNSSILSRKNKWMTKMSEIGAHVRNRKNLLNLLNGRLTNMST